MKSLIFLVVLATAIYTASSLCNTCSAITNLACVDRNKFKVCSSSGLPEPPAITCPPGTICTPDALVCSPESSAEPSCNMCKTCNANKVFACTGYNSFALCYGTARYDDSYHYICPDDLVCNIDSPNICIDKNITGIGSTCPWSTIETTTVATEPPTTPTTTSTTTTTTTTTVSPLTNPTQYCASKATAGRFEVPSDSTCTQYVSCYSSNGNWRGAVYYCPIGTFFNPTAQMCGVEVPDRCALPTDAEVCD